MSVRVSVRPSVCRHCHDHQRSSYTCFSALCR